MRYIVKNKLFSLKSFCSNINTLIFRQRCSHLGPLTITQVIEKVGAKSALNGPFFWDLNCPSGQMCISFLSTIGWLVFAKFLMDWIFVGAVDPKVLAKCDLCHNDPCQNGATCRPLPNRDYECVCAPGFYGKNCDAVIDACYGNPCTNNAKCQVKEAGRFTWVLLLPSPVIISMIPFERTWCQIKFKHHYEIFTFIEN